MEKRKELIAGLVAGYLLTSYFEWSFPGFWFWFFIMLCCSLGLGMYLLWRRINQDIVDY